MRVCVYKNLNLGNWTIAEVSGRNGRGRKIAGVPSVTLADVVFIVQPAAQAKVMAGAARSVHAWAIGTIADGMGTIPISYNPRRAATFYCQNNGQPITGAEIVLFAADGRAYAAGIR
jgi:hypothetical protein